MERIFQIMLERESKKEQKGSENENLEKNRN